MQLNCPDSHSTPSPNNSFASLWTWGGAQRRRHSWGGIAELLGGGWDGGVGLGSAEEGAG